MDTAHISTVIADQPPLDTAAVLDADLDLNANQSQVETQPKTNSMAACLDENVEQSLVEQTINPSELLESVFIEFADQSQVETRTATNPTAVIEVSLDENVEQSLVESVFIEFADQSQVETRTATNPTAVIEVSLDENVEQSLVESVFIEFADQSQVETRTATNPTAVIEVSLDENVEQSLVESVFIEFADQSQVETRTATNPTAVIEVSLDENVEQSLVEQTINHSELLESVFIEFADQSQVETRTATNPTAVIDASLDENVEQSLVEQTINHSELLESVFIEFADQSQVETRTATNPTAVIDASLDENVEQSLVEQTINPSELLESVFIEFADQSQVETRTATNPTAVIENVEQSLVEQTINPTELLESVFIEFADQSQVETRTATNPTAVIENVEQSLVEQTINPTELLESVFIEFIDQPLVEPTTINSMAVFDGATLYGLESSGSSIVIPVVYDLASLSQYEQLILNDSAVLSVADSSSNVSNVFEQAPTSDIAKGDSEPSVDVAQSTHSETSVFRKRPRCEQLWAKNRRKHMRNKGQEYVSQSGKIVPPKVFNCISAGCCKSNCAAKIDEEERQEIHRNFWQLGSHTAQTTYIAGCVEQKKVATRRSFSDVRDAATQASGKRKSFQKTFSRLYALATSERRVKVCKKLFLQTLGVSDGRVNRILLNQRLNGGVPQGDKRGKYEHTHQQLPLNLIEEVKAHVRSFPTNMSHYTRSHSASRLFLSPNLNISRMYHLFEDKCKANSQEHVKESMYRNIFNTHFNLSFHTPRKDTCRKCDCFRTQIDSTKDLPSKNAVIAEYQLHLRKADGARKALQEDGKDKEYYHAFTFDLQKVFSLPSLTTGEAYYCRQLSAYNLGIHSITTGAVTMNTWHEGIASRGPEEVSSCLLEYCKQLAEAGVRTVTAYSDSCGGQNRNYKVALMWSYICQKYKFQEINHKFLVSGHSYLPNDADFGIIEKSLRKKSYIYTYDEWCAEVQTCCKKNPYKIVKMTSDKFVSIRKLTDVLNVRKVSDDGHKVKWLSIQWLMVKVSEPTKLYYKYSVQEDVEFSSINVARRGNLTDVATVTLQPLYCTPRSLSAEKVADIKKLLKYVPPVHHGFFESIFDAAPPTPQQHYYEDELLCESEVSDDDKDEGPQSQKAHRDSVPEAAQSQRVILLRKRLASNKPTANNKTNKSDRKSCRPTQQAPSVSSRRSCNKSTDMNPRNIVASVSGKKKKSATTSVRKIKKQ